MMVHLGLAQRFHTEVTVNSRKEYTSKMKSTTAHNKHSKATMQRSRLRQEEGQNKGSSSNNSITITLCNHWYSP